MSRRPAEPREPAPREETVRESIRAALREEALTARDLSARVGLPEKAVPAHLEHLARSARARGETFHVEPPRCAKCGFTFERSTRPSRCPKCRAESIEAARFSLSGGEEAP